MSKIIEMDESKPSINIGNIEGEMLKFPQADCPVSHYFGDGIYIREVVLQAGIIAIGHEQKFDQMNVMISGKVAMLNVDGTIKVLEAPLTFMGKAGRKIGYVIETCIWQNIYATDEKNIDKLEELYLNKSDEWKLNHEQLKALDAQKIEDDRIDFYKALSELEVDAETVREQSEFTGDQIAMPAPYDSIVSTRSSDIHGIGLFLSFPMVAESVIAPARISGKRTPAGRYVNHSKSPNCYYRHDENGDIFLIAKYNIDGCKGGSVGTELTVDYRQAVDVNHRSIEKCQE